MRRADLIDALKEMNAEYDPAMSVPEMRSLYMELRGPVGKQGLGLTKCTLAQLIERCQDEGLTVPEKPTRGLLLRILRFSTMTDENSEVTCGQYKNYLFKEVPQDYLDWAIKEWEKGGQCSADLARLAKWAKKQRESPPDRGYGARFSASSPAPAVPKMKGPGAKGGKTAKSVKEFQAEKNPTSARKPKARALSEEEYSLVTSDGAIQTTDDEIHDLEERLQILKEVKKAEEVAAMSAAANKSSSAGSGAM